MPFQNSVTNGYTALRVTTTVTINTRRTLTLFIKSPGTHNSVIISFLWLTLFRSLGATKGELMSVTSEHGGSKAPGATCSDCKKNNPLGHFQISQGFHM